MVPDAGSALQTLCLKSQGHPERYKAASRALKAISKVRGVWGERRRHRDQAEVCPFPPSAGDPEGRAGFHTGLFTGLMGKPRPRGRRARTWSGSPSWGRQRGRPGRGLGAVGWGAVGGGGSGPSPRQRPPLAPQLVQQCNEGARRMERTEQMYELHARLDFGRVKVGASSPPEPAPGSAGAQPRALPQRPLNGASVSHQSLP